MVQLRNLTLIITMDQLMSGIINTVMLMETLPYRKTYVQCPFKLKKNEKFNIGFNMHSSFIVMFK